MKRHISLIKAGALFLAVLLLFGGVYLIETPKPQSGNKAEVIHTYLVKIPKSAGVCPYTLMTMTKGKLQMVEEPNCVCPYSQHSIYMKARSKNEKSVMAMLPASLQNKVQIEIADNLDSGYSKSLPRTKVL